MIPHHTRDAIARLPLIVDAEPHERLLVAAWDASGTVRHVGSFAIGGARPLDEPLLESSLWKDDVDRAMAVVYSRTDRLDLKPLTDAWGYRGRTTLEAAWAGASQWRSYSCSDEACCAHPHAYTAWLPTHPMFAPLEQLAAPLGTWRRSMWRRWSNAVGTTDGLPSATLGVLAESLFDIPMRDAVLASSAAPEARPALTEALTQIIGRAPIGTAIPAYTCRAAMHYLDGELDRSRDLVDQVLEVEEYSLARLLANGLAMQAPPSLLARSFAHFSPTELLAA